LSSVKLSAAEPVTQLRHIKIVECGEELVDFLKFCPALRLDAPRFKYRRETLVRRSVAEKLCEATKHLPKGYQLAMIEGWRPPYIQKRMYKTVWGWFEAKHPDWSHTRMVRTVNQFTAPMNKRVPPPHTTGGAVDVMLSDTNGKLMDHFSPYEPFDTRGAAFDVSGLSDAARKTRDILAEALLAGGLTNYPSEYWHWSYGDQGWAYRGGHPNAIYAATEPVGWQPAPEDLGDHPLERIDP
jgi:D-alanyl-D-alanine dipeptidase